MIVCLMNGSEDMPKLDQPMDTFICNHCDLSFKEEAAVVDHLASQHEDSKKLFRVQKVYKSVMVKEILPSHASQISSRHLSEREMITPGIQTNSKPSAIYSDHENFNHSNIVQSHEFNHKEEFMTPDSYHYHPVDERMSGRKQSIPMDTPFRQPSSNLPLIKLNPMRPTVQPQYHRTGTGLSIGPSLANYPPVHKTLTPSPMQNPATTRYGFVSTNRLTQKPAASFGGVGRFVPLRERTRSPSPIFQNCASTGLIRHSSAILPDQKPGFGMAAEPQRMPTQASQAGTLLHHMHSQHYRYADARRMPYERGASQSKIIVKHHRTSIKEHEAPKKELQRIELKTSLSSLDNDGPPAIHQSKLNNVVKDDPLPLPSELIALTSQIVKGNEPQEPTLQKKIQLFNGEDYQVNQEQPPLASSPSPSPAPVAVPKKVTETVQLHQFRAPVETDSFAQKKVSLNMYQPTVKNGVQMEQQQMQCIIRQDQGIQPDQIAYQSKSVQKVPEPEQIRLRQSEFQSIQDSPTVARKRLFYNRDGQSEKKAPADKVTIELAEEKKAYHDQHVPQAKRLALNSHEVDPVKVFEVDSVQLKQDFVYQKLRQCITLEQISGQSPSQDLPHEPAKRLQLNNCVQPAQVQAPPPSSSAVLDPPIEQSKPVLSRIQLEQQRQHQHLESKEAVKRMMINQVPVQQKHVSKPEVSDPIAASKQRVELVPLQAYFQGEMNQPRRLTLNSYEPQKKSKDMAVEALSYAESQQLAPSKMKDSASRVQEINLQSMAAKDIDKHYYPITKIIHINKEEAPGDQRQQLDIKGEEFIIKNRPINFEMAPRPVRHPKLEMGQPDGSSIKIQGQYSHSHQPQSEVFYIGHRGSPCSHCHTRRADYLAVPQLGQVTDETMLQGITFCEQCMTEINRKGSHDFDHCESCQREWKKLDGRVHVPRECGTCKELWEKHLNSGSDYERCDICYWQLLIHNSSVHNPAFCANCQAQFEQFLRLRQYERREQSQINVRQVSREEEWQWHLQSPHNIQECNVCYQIWLAHRYQSEDFTTCRFCQAEWDWHVSQRHQQFECHFCMDSLHQHSKLHGKQKFCKYCQAYSDALIREQLKQLVVEQYMQEKMQLENGQFKSEEKLLGVRYASSVEQVSQQLQLAITEYYQRQERRNPSRKEVKNCLEDVSSRIHLHQEIDLEEIVLERIRADRMK